MRVLLAVVCGLVAATALAVTFEVMVDRADIRSERDWAPDEVDA